MRAVVGLLLLCPLAGCAIWDRTTAQTVPWGQQREALLEVVPLGTQRDEAGQRLQAAGIEFSPSGAETWTPGSDASIFYCDRWTRDKGEVWPLEVALLFDDQDRLYALRNSQAQTDEVEFLPPSPDVARNGSQ